MTFKAERNYPKKRDGLYRYKVVYRVRKNKWSGLFRDARYQKGVTKCAVNKGGSKPGIYVYTHLAHARKEKARRQARRRRLLRRNRARARKLRLPLLCVVIKVRCKGFRAGTTRHDRSGAFLGCLERWSQATPVGEVR